MTTDELIHFSPSESRTIEAAMARIIPTDDYPGARDARTIRWLDRYLSGTAFVHAKPDGSGFLTLSPRDEKVWKQRISRMADEYRRGIVALDRAALAGVGLAFADASDDQQDQVLRDLEHSRQVDGKIVRANENSFDEDSASFFDLLVVHTRQAFYSDPVYGGNADQVGWRYIGFPGPKSMGQVQRGEYDTTQFFDDDARLEDQW